MLRTLALPLVALLLTGLAHAADKPQRIVSTTPSVTGILLAINAPVIATAAAAPSRLTDAKGFFRQWAEVADQRAVQVLYPNLQFDLEAVIGWAPDLLVVSATGADSVLQHQAELQAQGINSTVVNYSNHSWQEMAVELGKVTGLEQQAQAAQIKAAEGQQKIFTWPKARNLFLKKKSF